MSKAAKNIIIKKRWVPLRAPKLFNNASLGETFVADPALSVGKRVSVSLATLTGEHQRQSTMVSFEVTGLENGVLVTETREIKLAPSAIKRAVRRNKGKVADSFLIKTQDGKKVRVKTLLVTRNKVTSSVLSSLHKKTRDFVARTASKQDFESLCADVLGHKIQKNLHDNLKKTYPLSMCEVRWLKMERGSLEGAPIVEAPAQESKPVDTAKDAAPVQEA